MADHALMVAELKMVCQECCCLKCWEMEEVKPVDVVAAVRLRVEQLATHEQLDRLSDVVKEKYTKVFSDIPHIDKLPTDVYCRIKLKDATKTFVTQSYSIPHKYKEVWLTLIQQHLDAG